MCGNWTILNYISRAHTPFNEFQKACFYGNEYIVDKTYLDVGCRFYLAGLTDREWIACVTDELTKPGFISSATQATNGVMEKSLTKKHLKRILFKKLLIHDPV